MNITFLRLSKVNLLLISSVICIFLSTSVAAQEGRRIEFPIPPRVQGQTDVLQLACEPLDTVRIAFIGLGMRGSDAVERYMNIEGVKVVVLCDPDFWKVDACQKVLLKNGRPAAATYKNASDWKEVCRRKDVDLVYVCTHWQLHTPIAVYAMQHGKHVAIEVPAALTVEDCWKLVNTAEQTRRHCMMLENCCYDFFEMATLNMAQKGFFGEVVHCEAAYIHDLRWLQFDEKDGYWDMWRLRYNTSHTGNPYPTHGLGPVCQILNIHRGDKMDYLVSMSTNQVGMSAYAKEKFGGNSPQAKVDYKLGDMNTTLIRTAKGKTIMLQHDITSPRPYNRIHMVSGTKAFAQKYPVQGIAMEPKAHSFVKKEVMDSLLAVYEHPFAREIGELARKVGGHGGMDFIMDYRLIYCLRHGLPLDEDVYDAAEWSCITELSEQSVLNGSAPVQIPDFTRGDWNKLKGLEFKK
ncbi:MAG TPA: acetylgalactosaminidase [Bacteroidales bacterium]|nr:MAG: acetylgalactosaminidase [Bacteroidetes bacterium GWE2_42_24]OFY30929.1 MAG: acetylgalactosaminidase [Bacteroidetes bacterium GWF2_43_11]HBZ66428.1 acetylgalactosaminidase [Bacteroidales bacterium]